MVRAQSASDLDDQIAMRDCESCDSIAFHWPFS